MMLRLKNFFITFIIAMLAFGAVAYVGVGIVRDAIYTSEILDSNDNFNANDNRPSQELPGHSFSFVLIGADRAHSVSARAETIIFVRMIHETNEILVVPIPTTTIVDVVGVEMTLGEAFGHENAQFVADTVMLMTGLNVDFIATTTFTGMASIIDHFHPVHGITFTVPFNMSYSNASTGLNVNLQQGIQGLTGTQAVNMLRFPNHPTPVGQMELAVNFLLTLYRSAVAPAHLQNANTLFSELNRHVTTNFTVTDLFENIDLIFNFRQMTVLDTVHIPGQFAANGNFTYDHEEARRVFQPFR